MNGRIIYLERVNLRGLGMRNCFAVICFFLSVCAVHAQTYNWSQDIAPIIYENCSGCHHDGGIAPFELMGYLDVYHNAHAIWHTVEEREMPPWPADPEYHNFANETYLTQEEIDAIIWWVNNGQPTGDLNLAPDPPEFLPTGSLLDTIDYVVDFPDYTLQSNYDEYRWFVIENPFDEDVYISKLEVIPGLSSVVHHADLFYDNSGISLMNDNADPLPGFNNSTGSPNNSFYINAWQPGAFPAEYPEGWGIKVPAGADLVVEVHYGPGGQGQTDDTRMNLQFVKDTENVRPVYAGWLMNQSSHIIDGPVVIPANEVVTFHQVTQPLTNDLSVISICPHLHFLGKSYKVWYEYQGEEFPLIDIPNWDFHWQKYYTYPTIKKIPAGAVLKSEVVYDNTTNNHDQPFDPPQTTYIGSTTLDEMLLCYFIYAYYQEGDELIVMEESSELFDLNSVEQEVFNLFPNPGNELVSISGYFPNDQELTFRIYSSDGKIVHESFRINSRDIWYEQFDISELQQGLYFLEWEGSSTSGSERFIKN